jgi:hypothetical protein
MSRAIDARLGRMERAFSIDPDDEFAWLGRLSDDDLDGLIREVKLALSFAKACGSEVQRARAEPPPLS